MKANRQKKKGLFWTTFFLSILEAGASAVALVGLGLSTGGCINKYFKVKISTVFYT